MNLADPGTLKEFLLRHGLTASKGMGQHFLASSRVVTTIVSRFEGIRGVLEIGPGPGVLTGPLSERCERMIAIELDETMVAALGESAPRADVRRLDALKANLPALLEELPTPRAVVSNLPYYITGPLVTRIAEAKAGYEKAVLMMQKEVAQRVVAGPRTPARGSLSVYLQLQFDIKLVCHAPAGSFMPPPKVDSSVLELTPREMSLDASAQARLFRIVRLAFTQPRKTLANNLSAGLARSRDEMLEAIASCGLTPTARPQELTLEQWVALSASLPV